MAVILAVQQGTATLSTTTLRADVPLLTVDTSKTFCTAAWVGGDNAEGSQSYPLIQLYDANSLAIIRKDSGNALIVGWYVIEFSAGAVVYHNTAFHSAGTSTFLLPTVVDTTNAFLATSYYQTEADYNLRSLVHFSFLGPSSVQTVSVGVATTSNLLGFQTVELTGVRIQSGKLRLATGTTENVVALTEVDTSATSILSTQVGDDNDASELGLRLLLINGTTLHISRFDVGPAVETSWFVIEHTDGTVVQSGTARILSTAGSDQTIVEVDTTRSVSWYSGHNQGGGQYQVSNISDEFRQMMGYSRLTSPTNLFCDTAVGTSNFAWFVTQYNTAGQAVVVTAGDDASFVFASW